jgi:hypothetical protein
LVLADVADTGATRTAVDVVLALTDTLLVLTGEAVRAVGVRGALRDTLVAATNEAFGHCIAVGVDTALRLDIAAAVDTLALFFGVLLGALGVVPALLALAVHAHFAIFGAVVVVFTFWICWLATRDAEG